MLFETARKLIISAAEKLHSGCLFFAPHSPFQDLYQSFVCGASLQDPGLSRLYTELGLIHIVVVSGAHLLFLDSLLRIFHKDPSPWTLPVLTFYSLMTGFEAPVVRSLLQMVLRVLQKKVQLHWTHPVETLAAGLWTLLLLGPSLSLQLSWVASLGLSLQKSPLVAQVRVYLFLIPLLTTLQVAHPTTVLVNLALAPVLSALAFPASLVCFFVPQMSQLVDFFWSGAHGLLQWVQQEVSLGGAPPGATAGEWTWLYVGGLQLLLLSLYTAKKRKSLASL